MPLSPTRNLVGFPFAGRWQHLLDDCEHEIKELKERISDAIKKKKDASNTAAYLRAQEKGTASAAASLAFAEALAQDRAAALKETARLRAEAEAHEAIARRERWNQEVAEELLAQELEKKSVATGQIKGCKFEAHERLGLAPLSLSLVGAVVMVVDCFLELSRALQSCCLCPCMCHDGAGAGAAGGAVSCNAIELNEIETVLGEQDLVVTFIANAQKKMQTLAKFSPPWMVLAKEISGDAPEPQPAAGESPEPQPAAAPAAWPP